jgi:hypothetical protein
MRRFVNLGFLIVVALVVESVLHALQVKWIDMTKNTLDTDQQVLWLDKFINTSAVDGMFWLSRVLSLLAVDYAAGSAWRSPAIACAQSEPHRRIDCWRPSRRFDEERPRRRILGKPPLLHARVAHFIGMGHKAHVDVARQVHLPVAACLGIRNKSNEDACQRSSHKHGTERPPHPAPGKHRSASRCESQLQRILRWTDGHALHACRALH